MNTVYMPYPSQLLQRLWTTFRRPLRLASAAALAGYAASCAGRCRAAGEHKMKSQEIKIIIKAYQKEAEGYQTRISVAKETYRNRININVTKGRQRKALETNLN